MRLHEWLKPPQNLLLGLGLLTLVSISTVGWFGWKLLQTEQFVEAQRAQERLEQSADQTVSALRGALAETGDRLSAWLANPTQTWRSKSGLLLGITASALTAIPAERLLYHPLPSTLPEAPPELYASGEDFEFGQLQPEKAIEFYRRLAESPDAAIRSGALIRLARVHRSQGSTSAACMDYQRASQITNAQFAGTPVDLIARHAQARVCGQPSTLERDLRNARWHLTRAQFHYYWSESKALQDPPADAVAVAELTNTLWNERPPEPSGQRTIWANRKPFVVIWRGAPDRRAIFLTPANDTIPSNPRITWAAVDNEGRTIMGQRQPGRKAVRASTETGLPWTLYVMSANATTTPPQQPLLLIAITTMIVFLLSGAYFIARAIRKEIEVSRLQTDFVSAVSHEFRSPLTSMRQLSELLALGRVPNEARRQTYYETLVTETHRLQRLIESLLDFGRMEAGQRRYEFQNVDVPELVKRVVSEFEMQGRTITVNTEPCVIAADPDAIAVAVRNLVDNALKYSPPQSRVAVNLHCNGNGIQIGVQDEGPGISQAESKRIFEKFVRGSAAVSGNVRGAGIGLSMVRRIADAHGGAIQVASKPGSGSTFTLSLPKASE